MPDLLDSQVNEEQLLGQVEASGSVESTSAILSPLSFHKGDIAPTVIDPTATIADDAIIGPGCHIGPGVTIGCGAQLWNVALNACEIGKNTLIERSNLSDVKIGDAVTIRSSRLEKSCVGSQSTVDAASVVDSTLSRQTTLSAFADLEKVSTSYGSILGGRFVSAQIDTHLMSMHMAGNVSGIVAESTPVEMPDTQGTRTIFIQAIPMIGGGARCDGTTESPIRMEGCFVGSNAHIRSGVRLGFGTFVLGKIGPDVQLPPFTLAFGGEPTTYRIGQVLTRLPEVVISHFINWTYQASQSDQLEAIVHLVESSIKRGLASVCFEQDRRTGLATIQQQEASTFFDLTPYTDAQLDQGREIYEKSLKSGDWELIVQSDALKYRRNCQ